MSEKFDKEKYWGISLAMDLFNCDPKIIRSEKRVKEYITELCYVIEMRRIDEIWLRDFGETPEVKGITFFQAIETSCITGHLVNSTNNAYIDIFTCKNFEKLDAITFTTDYFKSKNVMTKLFYRNKNNSE